MRAQFIGKVSLDKVHLMDIAPFYCTSKEFKTTEEMYKIAGRKIRNMLLNKGELISGMEISVKLLKKSK